VTRELLWVLTLLFIAIVLFATNKLRMDVVALLVIIAFVLSGTLTLPEALMGFSDPNVILIAALFVIGEGLVRTGVAYQVGDWLMHAVTKGRLANKYSSILNSNMQLIEACIFFSMPLQKFFYNDQSSNINR